MYMEHVINGISRQSSILGVDSHPSHASLRVGRVYRTDKDKQCLEWILVSTHPFPHSIL